MLSITQLSQYLGAVQQRTNRGLTKSSNASWRCTEEIVTFVSRTVVDVCLQAAHCASKIKWSLQVSECASILFRRIPLPSLNFLACKDMQIDDSLGTRSYRDFANVNAPLRGFVASLRSWQSVVRKVGAAKLYFYS